MDFSSIKASVARMFSPVETKSAVVPYDAWGLEGFLTPTTISSVVVSSQSAMRVPAVALAVNLIASSIGSLPARIVRSDSGSKEILVDHPAFGLIARAANDRLSAGKLRERLAMDALLHGNGFAFANRVDGRVVEILRLEPSAIGIQIEPTTGEVLYRLNAAGGRILDPRDVIHIPAPVSFDGVTGVSPIQLAREAIALAITMEARAAKLFGVSARPSGVIEFADKMGEEDLKRIGTGWRAAHEGGGNAGKTALLHGGGKFTPFTFSSVDAQFLEMRREQIVEIARAFGVPATMLFELSNGTFANTEQQGRQFVTFTLAPWLSTFAGELGRALLGDEDGASIEFDTDALVAVDTAARTDRIAKLRAAGVMTANDARRELGLPAHADGDRLDSPFTTAGNAAPSTTETKKEQAAA
ncbi:phage portal protein [Aureimonas leprariae]|uniref:Phage portal protein n=1 Tax=Plantimonas leprariae TaxID=2615207 RepID=A0A7V7TWB7_9HYPH|nr:phage portal protein [Aureimonas leprariae]KAB0679514.1 phage portal protein [Aureimonas leprariae]